MDKVRFGVIGTGGMGTAHIRFIKDIEEAELAAVCDIDEAVCEQVSSEKEVPGFVDYKELIDSGLVDAVIVASPHYFHPPISVYAMEQGVHVLSEKPVAATVKAADEMNRAAEETGVKFAVMYQRRTTPLYQAARKLIDEGRLGELYRTCCIDPHFRSQAYYDSAGWRATWRGEGGGVTINQAPHGIDVFMSLGGLPSRVMARTATRRHDIEVEDEASALLEYENGAIGYYHTSTTEAPATEYMEFCGEKGKLVLFNGELTFWSLETPVQEFTDTTEGMWDSPSAVEEEVALEERKTGHAAVTRNFARAILYDEPLITPGVEGIWTVEFINALILSGQSEKPVDIPVDREEYEAFIEEMKRTSKEKEVAGPDKRITDTSFAP
ncbi:MAG: Gfo/Idh/MocA family oxidoreductase [Chloroflexota bacterium]|nr:Gfo/Idh/MocA family oxidoreductase [Chloroflexota bacterium]